MNTRIILCEDNNDFRESLQQYIDSKEGFLTVASLASANKIVEEMEKMMPDVILMDIDMPGINGIQATTMVKARFPAVHVLMLTVYDDEDKIFKAILAGATGYLLKKTAPQKIMECIQEVMDGGASMNASIVKKVLSFFNQPQTESLPPDYLLSDREKTILKCIVQGDSYKMIADHCAITIGTVRFHINNIYKKLHINSKSEAVAKAINEKLLHDSLAETSKKQFS